MNEEQWRALDRIDQYDFKGFLLEPLRLYELISKLESLEVHNKQVKIVYSDGCVAYPNVLDRSVVYKNGHFEQTRTCFVSWRGGYENLSIDILKNEKHVTVGHFLDQCEYVIEKQLYGYKGGLYLMDRLKIVYVSEFSEGDKCAIFDVKETGDEIHLMAKRYLCGWF
jgi:hypothetical protein